MRNTLIAVGALGLVAAVAIILYVYNPDVSEELSQRENDRDAESTETDASKTDGQEGGEGVHPVPEAADKGKADTGTAAGTPKDEKHEPDKPEAPKEPEDPPAEPPEDETLDVPAVLAAAEAQAAAGKPAEAMKTLSEAVAKGTEDADLGPLKAQLTKLADEQFFSNEPSPLAVMYKVVPGDKLRIVAGAHETTEDLIARINGIEDKNLIRVDQRLKIIKGPFDVVVEKSKLRLTVYKDGVWVREFPICIGDADNPTPEGDFVAGEKLINPDWTKVWPAVPHGDRDKNPLGTRWITFKDNYGIHGTWEPNTIGTAASNGCIRLHNKDIEQLFDLVVRGKSKITIKP